MTVRRDLDVLDDAGLVAKVHGGATLRDEHSTDEPGFEAKSLRNTWPRSTPSRWRPPRCVRPAQAIGITAGTTTWQLAYHLVDIADLTVVTNSVRVADVLHPPTAPIAPWCSPAACARRATRSSARSRSARCARCTSTRCSWACTA